MKQVNVLYGQPTDRSAFDRHYAETHVPLVERIPFVIPLQQE
ncbi:MAG: EthD family reductase [Alphaproteobacteria bacterium]|nr:EthD family reductase [Alphaproteobacteria bacterium]